MQRVLSPSLTPVLTDPFATTVLTAVPVCPAFASSARCSAFKTSTGVEVRLFMPVINVPFRLIFAYNPQRGGCARVEHPAATEGVPIPICGWHDVLTLA